MGTRLSLLALTAFVLLRHLSLLLNVSRRRVTWQLPDGDVPDGDAGWKGCYDEGGVASDHRFRLGPRTLIFGCSWTSSSGTKVMRMPQPA